MEHGVERLMERYNYWKQIETGLDVLSSEDPGRDLYIGIDDDIKEARKALRTIRQMIFMAGVDNTSKEAALSE